MKSRKKYYIILKNEPLNITKKQFDLFSRNVGKSSFIDTHLIKITGVEDNVVRGYYVDLSK